MIVFSSGRGIAQPGSAPALGAGGLQFKSGCPDQSRPLRASLGRKSLWRRLLHAKGTVKPNHLRSICILICFAYFVACFWPFKFHPRNNVHWHARRDGLRLGWQSIVFTDSAIELGKAVAPANQPASVSIELWLTPESEPHIEARSILSLCDENLNENFSVAEWRSSLLVRAALLNAPAPRRYREVGVKDALPRGRRCFVAVTFSPRGTAIYLDGAPARTYPKFLLRPSNLRGKLLLGSSAQGRKKWNGELLGLAAFDRTLEPAEVLRHYLTWTGPQSQGMKSEAGLTALYFFNERRGGAVEDYSGAGHPLLIPEYYEVLRRTVLHAPWQDDTPNLDFEDIFVNILGFIPFGYFYFIYRARLRPGRNVRNAAVTVLVASMLSLAIELIQVFLPMRDSSMTDWISNTIGGGLGVAIAVNARLGQTVIERLQGRDR